MLPSLDMPHHLKADHWCEYREGVTVRDNFKDESKDAQTLVETGWKAKVYIQPDVPISTRVTVRMNEAQKFSEFIDSTAVAPSAPREEQGWYWGYNVRVAESLSSVLTECPFDGGYDLTLGTSERGTPLSELGGEEEVPEFQHMLIVFGGVAGLEVAFMADKELQKLEVKEPKDLFDFWVNLVPSQGSRTIRTEEAIWLGLMGLKGVTTSKGRR